MKIGTAEVLLPLLAVGNKVDVKRATWTNAIGDPELTTVWTDSDFDPKQAAFYYAKVIEYYAKVIEIPRGARRPTIRSVST